jgi:hypothetical protein
MPAEGLEEIPAGGKPLIQIESSRGPRRSLANASLIYRDDNRRPMKLLDQPSRRNAHDPDVPPTGRQDHSRRYFLVF